MKREVIRDVLSDLELSESVTIQDVQYVMDSIDCLTSSTPEEDYAFTSFVVQRYVHCKNSNAALSLIKLDVRDLFSNLSILDYYKYVPDDLKELYKNRDAIFDLAKRVKLIGNVQEEDKDNAVKLLESIRGRVRKILSSYYLYRSKEDLHRECMSLLSDSILDVYYITSDKDVYSVRLGDIQV